MTAFRDGRSDGVGPSEVNLDLYDELGPQRGSFCRATAETDPTVPLVCCYDEEGGQSDAPLKLPHIRARGGNTEVRVEPYESNAVPLWLEALRKDVQNILREELSAMRDQWSTPVPKKELQRHGEGGPADTRRDYVIDQGAPSPAPRSNRRRVRAEPTSTLSSVSADPVPSVYGPERSLNLRVGDRVVVFKQARTKGRTGTVIDPYWQPGLVQVAMHEADEKGNLKSYKHADLRLIKEKSETLCVGSRVVIFKRGPVQGRTASVINPNPGEGLVQVALDEADEHGSMQIYKHEDLRIIQERTQTLRPGDRVAVSKEARTKGRTGTVIEPNWQHGLVQVAMDEADEKGKTKSYEHKDLILIQDLRHIQQKTQSLEVGDRIVVAKDCSDKDKTGTVIDPDWQLGLVQVSMDEANARGRMKTFNPNDLKLLEDVQILSLFSKRTLHAAQWGNESSGIQGLASWAVGGRVHGFSVFHSKVILESQGDPFEAMKTYFPEPASCVVQLVRSKLFFYVTMLVVFGYALWVGLSANEQMKDHRFRQQIIVGWIHVGFNSLFLAEMLLKISGLRGSYFVGKDCAWNWFEFVLAVASIVEMIFANSNIGWIARVLCIVRMFRICKLFYATTELRLMSFVLYQSMSTLVWVFIIYFVLTYCFSVIIMQSASTYRDDAASTRDAEFASVRAKYGHVWDSMLVLLNILTGGDWDEAVQPLSKLSPGYKIMFAAYMFFMTFGMLNVVIGVVCEKALFAIGSDRHLRTARHRENTRTFLRAMRLMFKEMDVNNCGYISIADFLAYIDNEATGDYLRSYGINTHSPHELFSFLDMQDGECTGEIDCPSFILAMERLAGGVRGSDLVLLRRDVREMKKMIKKQLGDQVFELKKAMSSETNLYSSGDQSPTLSPTCSPSMKEAASWSPTFSSDC